MRIENPFEDMAVYELFETLLPDFVLAFAFFTSVVYAVLGKRFDQQRPAITMSVAIGLALSIGLLWWEQSAGLSIRNLGPIAVGFAILILAFVMYQSIHSVGGSWAGAGITIGACILIAQVLGFKAPVDPQIIQTVTVAALIVGLIAFLTHTRGHAIRFPHVPVDLPNARRDMNNLYRNRHLSNQLTKRMKKVRKQADVLNEHPEEASDVLLQLKRMLPAEGYLTQRMAQLRARAHQIRNGHIARLEETKYVFSKLPVSEKKKASADMAASYNQLIGIDTRLERLDKTTAEIELRIRELTSQAQRYAANYDYQKLTDSLKAVEKLQHHNSRLFKTIEHTESKLASIAKKIAQEAKQVNAK
jgi:hypothetical protein